MYRRREIVNRRWAFPGFMLATFRAHVQFSVGLALESLGLVGILQEIVSPVPEEMKQETGMGGRWDM